MTRPLFTSLNKTEAKQIQPQVESLHKQNKEIQEQELANEVENRELHRIAKVYEGMMESMEVKIAAMYEDGTLKFTEADVSSD